MPLLLCYPNAATVLADYGAARFTWGVVRRELNAAGVVDRLTWQCNVTEAGLACTGPADAAVKIALVQQALAVQEGDLLFDAGRSVASYATLGGVRCVAGPVWSDRGGANGYTFVSYAARFEWQTLAPGGMPLTDFGEVVTVSGGLPRRVGFPIVNGNFSVVQTTTGPEPYEALQVGFGVGLTLRPFANPPLWPLLQTGPNPVTTASARRHGDMAPRYTDFRVDWSYRFVSNTPFVPVAPGQDVPTEWRG